MYLYKSAVKTGNQCNDKQIKIIKYYGLVDTLYKYTVPTDTLYTIHAQRATHGCVGNER